MPPLVDILKQEGISEPETVYFLKFSPSEKVAPDSGDKPRFKEIIEKGPIYSPNWTDNQFAVPDPPTTVYVIGPDSSSEAAAAFAEFCRSERVDLSKWYQIESHVRGLPGTEAFENAVHSISAEKPLEEEDGSPELQLSVVLDDVFETIAYRTFYGEIESPEATQSEVNYPVERLPETDFGDALRELLRNPREFTKERELNECAKAHPQQAADLFPELMDLLESDDVFSSYTVDSRYNQATIQKTFDAIASEDPDAVFAVLARLEELMAKRRSTTPAEVSCATLKTMVQNQPGRFTQLSPLLVRLWETRKPQPVRRVLDIVATQIMYHGQDQIEELTIFKDSFAGELIKRLDVTTSPWVLEAGCSALTHYELSEEESGMVAENIEIFVSALTFGGDRRGENIEKGLAMTITLEESADSENGAVTDAAPSGEVLYRLHRAAADVLTDIAEAHPETVMLYVDTLVDDLTASGDEMKVVRKEAKRILRTMVENLPGDPGTYDRLSKHDATISKLLESDSKYDVIFGVQWLRYSGSQKAIDALSDVHCDETHPHWHRATDALRELAPENVHPDKEPNNAYRQWLEITTNLATEQGRLPKSDEVRELASAPDTPFWEVFDNWSHVLQSLDIENERRTSNAPLRSALLSDLQRVGKEVDGVPTTGDIEAYSEYSYYDYKQEFGGITEAREAAGVDK